MITTCQYHCSGCNTCFSSLAAFDKHRVGRFEDLEDPRRCECPDETGFEYVDGECRIDADELTGVPIAKPARIWTFAGSRDRAAQRFVESPVGKGKE